MFRCMEACMLHTGYHSVPARKMLWEQMGDCNNPFISKAIRYKRFIILKMIMILILIMMYDV